MEITVRVKRILNKTKNQQPLPRYATGGAAGLDLRACVDIPLTVPPGARVKIPTGIAIEIPDKNMVGLVFPRSGLALKHGISLANSVGVIDSDYKGEIFIAVFNQDKEEYTIGPGERVAQLVFVPVFRPTLVEVENLQDTARGAGGFGSTGKI